MEQSITYFTIGALVVVALWIAVDSYDAVGMATAALFLLCAIVGHLIFTHHARTRAFTSAEVCRMLGQLQTTLFFSVPALAGATGMDEERAEALLELLAEESTVEKGALRRTHNNSLEYGYRRVR